jgi:hypothetical protein
MSYAGSRVNIRSPLLRFAILTGVVGSFFYGSLCLAPQPFLRKMSAAVVLTQAAISESKVSRYARAVLEIEPIRLKYVKQAKELLKGNLPKKLCLPGYVPPGLEKICSNYLSESKAVIERHQLTMDEFNDITTQASIDKELNNLIQKHMLERQ